MDLRTYNSKRSRCQKFNITKVINYKSQNMTTKYDNKTILNWNKSSIKVQFILYMAIYDLIGKIWLFMT